MNAKKSDTERVKVKKKKFFNPLIRAAPQGTIIFILTCLMILSITISWIIYIEAKLLPNCETTSKAFTLNTSRTRSVTTYSSGCVCNSGGNISCLGIQSVQELEAKLEEHVNCDAPKLIIEGSSLTTIPTSFLENSTLSFTILEMRKNSKMTDIEDGAFSAETFRGLQELTFEQSIINQLRKDSFYGIDHLRIFQYRMSATTTVDFEENFFECMSGIDTLQFHGIILNKEVFQKTTAGDVYLNNLENVDFSSNTIEELEDGVFKSFDKVRLLHLHFSTVRTVHVYAFLGMIELETIYLNGNNLRTLPEGVFGSHLPNLRHVYLANNNWICDCELQWLKESNVVVSSESLTCSNHYNAKFSDVDFCPTTTAPATTELTTDSSVESSTTTTESATTITETTTTETSIAISTLDDKESSKMYRQITCIDWAASSILITRSESLDLIHTQILTIKNEQFTFYFYDPDEDPVRLTVQIFGNITNFHLVFFNSFNTSEIGCVTNMGDTIELTELEREQTYTYCMLYGDETTVAPTDCFGFKVRETYGERVWIPNRLSTLIIVFSILIIILAIIFGGLLMYFCVRKHPTLIKGNERVIIISKKKPEVPTTPKEYEKPVYTPPSIDSMVSSATQSQYGYTKIKRKHYQSPMLRNVPERSAFNNEVSYIRPVGPTSYQLNTWRVNSRIGQPHFDTFEESIYHQSFPPPLPPPNDIRYVPRDENLYTTL